MVRVALTLGWVTLVGTLLLVAYLSHDSLPAAAALAILAVGSAVALGRGPEGPLGRTATIHTTVENNGARLMGILFRLLTAAVAVHAAYSAFDRLWRA
jgi:hypothetical protein